MRTKRLAPWLLVVGAMVGVAVLATACSGGGSTTSATTSKPAVTTTTKPATTTAATTAPKTTTTAPATTTASGAPPKAPAAIHTSLWNNSPPTCTTCHAVGGAGVGVPGGTGMPASHQGRTSDLCKGCHQLGS
jgi:hypothetical protein